MEVERVPGNPFTDGEPIFLLRARDKTAPGTLRAYRILCEVAGSPLDHLQAIDELADTFERWQSANPQLVKTPD